jgi:hypothetical protein
MMEKKPETKSSLCPLCLEPVDASKGEKIVVVWGKLGHFRCAQRAHAKYESYPGALEKSSEEQAKTEVIKTATPPENREASTGKRKPEKRGETARKKASPRITKRTR